ncbi:MAG: insulinase family protein [Bdellovibrionaceae bacterium]|nr:insulinase family protein [Pseudobdellovibrionaceae bacterium]
MRGLVLTLGAFLAAACAHRGPKNESVKIRQVQEFQLDNGLRVFLLEDRSLPRVSIQALVRSGSLYEEVPGVNSLMVNLLEEGTRSRGRDELAGAIADLGSSIESAAGEDFSTISLSGLSSDEQKIIEIFADIMMNPAFRSEDFDRLRATTLVSLQRKKDDPGTVASEGLARSLFGIHPYGRDVQGTEESLSAMTREQIVSHWSRYWIPNRTKIALVGNFSDKGAALLKQLFSGWKPQNSPDPERVAVDQVSKFQLEFHQKKGLKQTQIRMGRIGIERGHPDYLKLRLAAVVLGGGWLSRLNQVVREKKGYTYSIDSAFEVNRQPGAFVISTFTKNETARAAVEEILSIYSEFVRSGITEDELKIAKALLIGQFPRAIETADLTAFNIMALEEYGVPRSYLTDFNKLVDRITVSEVNSAIRRHLHPENLKVVVYGDFQKW